MLVRFHWAKTVVLGRLTVLRLELHAGKALDGRARHRLVEHLDDGREQLLQQRCPGWRGSDP
jgi:hypothetical protein